MKKLIKPAIVAHVQLGKTKLALDWIETVSYVYGPEAALAGREGTEVAAFVKCKAYLKLAEPDAKRNILKSHLAEVVSM